MLRQSRDLISRAIGILDGLSYVVDDKIGNALMSASELLEQTLDMEDKTEDAVQEEA